MGPKGKRIAWDILRALQGKSYTTKELQQDFKLPRGTVNGELTYLSKQGFVMSVPVKEVRREYKITDAGKKYLEEQQKDPDLAQQTEAEAAADDKKINIYDTEQPEETAKEVKRKRFKLF